MSQLSNAVPFDPSSRTGWPRPDTSVLAENSLPPPDLPIEVFGPEWGGWIQQTATSASAPPDYVAVGLLSTGASLIGNARKCSPWSGWSEAMALWSCLVGRPSSNKSPALDALRNIIRRMESNLAVTFDETLRQYQTDQEAAKVRTLTWESEVKTAIKNKVSPPVKPEDAIEPDQPARPRISIMSATVEEVVNVMAGQPKGLIQIRDELASWLGDMGKYSSGGGDRGFYLEAFGGRPYISDRVKYSGSPKIIPHLTLSVLGTTQPDKVSSIILKGDDDGLASRFLYVWPERAPLTRPKLSADNEWAFITLHHLHELQMGEDENGNPCPVVRMLTDEAAAEFETWWTAHGDAIEQESGLLAGHMGKMPGVVLRLALILELLWWSASNGNPEPERISRKAVLAAITLAVDYFIPMARRVFGDAGLPQEQRLATCLAKYVVSNRLSRINARQIYRSRVVHGINTAETCKLATAYLEDCDFLKPAPCRSGNSAGAQRGDFIVNPMVYEVQS